MDLGPRRESYLGTGKPKSRDSLGRVLILTVLILAALYVVSQLYWQQNWMNPFAATPLPTRTADSYFDEAEVLYREGKLSDAIAAYRKAYDMAPDSWIALTKLVRVMAFQNHAVQAIEQYGASLKEFGNAESLAALCLAYNWNDQYEEALDSCVRAVSENPDYAEAHAYLSETYANLANWDAAYDEATQALELNNRNVDAQRALAYALEVRGDYEGAAEGYLRAIELHPRLGHLHIRLALNYRVLGENEQSIQSFQQAIEVDPDNPQAYDELGWTYYQMGDSSRAVVEIRRALEVDSDYSPAYGHLGVIDYVRQRYEDAVPSFEKAIAAGSTSLEYYYELGLSYIYSYTNALQGYTPEGLAQGCELGVPWLDKALERDPYCLPCWQGIDVCEGSGQ
ncbi:MAG: tetratricopeptide repeat protein [Chloroflexota bacterium]